MKAQYGKTIEFEQFCALVYSHEPYPCHLHYEKVLRFMWYQTFREKKKAGGNKEAIKGGVYFDYDDYKGVVPPASDSFSVDAFPVAVNPIGKCVFDAYKAVFHLMYKEQVYKGLNTKVWDHIWRQGLEELHKHVKERAPMIKRATYQEKVTSEFSPYTIIEHYNDIEQILWNDAGNASGRRSICANLRHRYCLLHLTTGILRCESLHRAEISDFMVLTPPKKDTDVHGMLLMINQIALGKTNHGRTLYGRATRHRDVRLCCCGALAFYLMYRIDTTGEFKDFTVEQWMDNAHWYDIKLLIDVIGPNNNKKEMLNDGYGKHIKKVLQMLSLSCEAILHLGRKIGSKILDLLEEESEAIRRMGQWNNSIFDNSYSSKLPLGPMRKLAGYSGSTKLYFNARTDVMPTDELLRMTPIGCWVYDAFVGVQDQAGSSKQTCLQVLNFLCEMNKVFLQDAAAMLVLHPDRGDSDLFQELPLFNTPQFTVSKQ